jgi:hypothetical protein
MNDFFAAPRRDTEVTAMRRSALHLGIPLLCALLGVTLVGASNGRAAGFLNVRPDSGASAPNPSLRFLVANTERMIIDNEGFIGLGVANPSSPIHHSTGAVLSATGQFISAFSRALKQDIRELSATILLFTAKTKTVSVTMFDLRESNDWGPISVLSITMLAITFVMVAAINHFTDRRRA